MGVAHYPPFLGHMLKILALAFFKQMRGPDLSSIQPEHNKEGMQLTLARNKGKEVH